MAISLYVGDHICIDVDDPGYGYFGVYFRSDDEARWGDNREVTLRGRDMWTALESLTTLATAGGRLAESGDVAKLWPMSIGEARKLLPALQTAVLYAAAGSDRAERLDEDADDLHDLLCARCNEGSYYSGHVTVSEDCRKYGHQPFGYAGDWDQAQEHAARERQWAEIRRRADAPTPVSTENI